MSAEHRAAESSRPVRDLANIAKWVRGLLFAQAGFSLLAALFALGSRDTTPSLSTGAHALVVLILPFLFIATGIAVLRWVYLANANTHAMGAQAMMSPGLAVGAYFIPIANLAMPFQSMRDIWKASTQPRDWEIVRAPALIGWWWLFWLLAVITDAVSIVLAGGSAPFEGAAEVESVFHLLSDLLTIPASLLLARIIGQVTAKQEVARDSSLFR